MKKIRIIHTNDVHSSFEKFLKMASVIKGLRNEASILLDAGDFNDFSSFVTYGSNGHAGLKMLNSLHYDALTIGNNEGFQNLNIIEDNGNTNLINILSCNIFKMDGSRINGIKPSIILNCNGIRLLVIGVSPYMPSYNSYYNNYGINAVEPFSCIEKEINDNKGNYDLVILLSHIGLKTDILLTQVMKNIDIIVSGHSHHTMDCVKVNGVYIHQSGVRGSHVGYMDIYLENNEIIDIKAENIEINDSINDDNEMKELYKQLVKETNEKLSKPFLDIPVDLTYKIDQECNLTNLLADYLKNNYQCDLAIINSGLTSSNLSKGFVSMKDILNVCNSPLYVSTMKVKGKVILDALKLSANKEKCHDSRRRPGFRGDFLGKLHVSYNCKIKQNGNEIECIIDNQKIDLDRYYTIVTSDYFLRGMGYEVFIENIDGKMYVQSIKEAIIEALKDKMSYKYINEFRWEK